MHGTTRTRASQRQSRYTETKQEEGSVSLHTTPYSSSTSALIWSDKMEQIHLEVLHVTRCTVSKKISVLPRTRTRRIEASRRCRLYSPCDGEFKVSNDPAVSVKLSCEEKRISVRLAVGGISTANTTASVSCSCPFSLMRLAVQSTEHLFRFKMGER